MGRRNDCDGGEGSVLMIPHTRTSSLLSKSDQLLRAAQSIALNIAEGNGNYDNDNEEDNEMSRRLKPASGCYGRVGRGGA